MNFTNKNGQPIPKISNNSILSSVHAMPLKDGPADSHNSFSLNRFKYIQSFHEPLNHNDQLKVKYIGGIYDSSSVISKKKMNTVGNATLNKNASPMSFVNTNKQDINSALRRTRSGGSVVPKKTSAIRNYS